MDEFNNDPNKNNNKNNNKRWSNAKRYISKVTEKDGFYIILFVCICIVATTGVWVSKNNIEKINGMDEHEDYSIVEEPFLDEPLEEADVSQSEEAANQDNSGVTTVDIEEQPKAEETNEETVQPVEEQKITAIPTSGSAGSSQQVLSAMIAPLAGNISADYADDKLVYSKTLEQWTTHTGIDISAREGTVVRTALDGIVSQIKKDQGLGITITIDHGNGVLTRYGQLSTDEMVTLGQEVKKGDPISGVGKGEGFEMAEGPHLHFEVLVDGKNVNPREYLPKVD